MASQGDLFNTVTFRPALSSAAFNRTRHGTENCDLTSARGTTGRYRNICPERIRPGSYFGAELIVGG
jgi:hypothetical protein